MLSQYELDTIMKTLQNGERAYLYYVTHMVESIKGLYGLDIYKSNPKFKIVKIEVKDIKNAYFEYLNYRNNPDQYHIESETYYDITGKHNDFYIVPNIDNKYAPRFPSIIYGNVHPEEYNKDTGEIEQKIDNSLIDFIYTNIITYGDLTLNEAFNAFINGKLDWKYRILQESISVDGVAYQYITSNWYILDTTFPTIEMPVINTHIQNSYFMNLNDALGYMEQLEA